MNKLTRSWFLFRSSVGVLQREPKLLVYPVVVSIATCIITLFFFAPLMLFPTGHSPFQLEHWGSVMDSLFRHPAGADAGAGFHIKGFTPAGTAYLGVLYFVSMFLATFFNVAFFHEILAALGGESVSIRRGLRFATSRLPAILMWTLFAGLIGLAIKMIEQKFELVGRLIARFVGLAWSVASVFAIPALVRDADTINPVTVLRRSAEALRRTWGESLIGYVGLAFGSWIILIGSVILLGGAAAISVALDNYWIIASVGVLWLFAIIAFSYLTHVAGQVYKAALYLYAVDGTVTAPFDREMLDQAWRFKKA